MTKEEHVRRLAEDPVYVIMGEEFSLGRKNREVAKELLDAGVKIIQYREKHKTWREKYGEAKEIAAMCEEYGATFIMNDSADIAVPALPLSVPRRIVPFAAHRQTAWPPNAACSRPGLPPPTSVATAVE